MRPTHKLKIALAGVLAASALALGATAQAATVDAGIFTESRGSAANPVMITVPDPGRSGPGDPGSSYFVDRVNFDLGSFTYFNMRSDVNNIAPFGVSIFENNDGTDFPYTGSASTYTSVLLNDLGLPRDYHLHPAGIEQSGGGSYTLTLWGTSVPLPLPTAAWLFGSGVIGLAGLARRNKAAAKAALA